MLTIPGSEASSSPSRNAAETRAVELLTRLGRRQDFFVVAFMAALDGVPGYAEGKVEPDELRRAAAHSFTVLTESLLERFRHGHGARQRLAQAAGDLAMRRAEQGIQPVHLAQAVRIDFMVLWEQLKGISAPEDAPVLVELAEPLWQVVDEYASTVYGAFLELREAQARKEAAALQQYLTDLLSGQPAPEMVPRIAAALGFSMQETLVLAASPSSPEWGGQLTEFARRHGGSGAACHAVTVGAHEFLIFPASRRGLTDALLGLPCAVATSVAGLDGVSVERQRLTVVANLLRSDDDHALSVETAWPRIAASANRSLGHDLSTALDAALAAAAPSESARVRDTVRAYLRTGSLKATAEIMFCHRNTVRNHLDRFAELTGLDVTVPEQAATVVVAWA